MKGLFALVCGLTMAACASPDAMVPAVAPSAATKPHSHSHTHNPGDHNHARGKMLMASDGTIDALLTAHLSSRDGHELDVFVERKGQPHALDVTSIDAIARDGLGGDKTMTFACAPRDERPVAEPEGRCSHFVASAHWMNPAEVLRVEAALPVGDARIAMVWRDFEPLKYAHHQD